MADEEEILLSIDEAALFLGVSKVTLRRWTRVSQVPFVRVNSRGDRRFRREDLEKFVHSHEVFVPEDDPPPPSPLPPPLLPVKKGKDSKRTDRKTESRR